MPPACREQASKPTPMRGALVGNWEGQWFLRPQQRAKLQGKRPFGLLKDPLSSHSSTSPNPPGYQRIVVPWLPCVDLVGSRFRVGLGKPPATSGNVLLALDLTISFLRALFSQCSVTRCGILLFSATLRLFADSNPTKCLVKTGYDVPPHISLPGHPVRYMQRRHPPRRDGIYELHY